MAEGFLTLCCGTLALSVCLSRTHTHLHMFEHMPRRLASKFIPSSLPHLESNLNLAPHTFTLQNWTASELPATKNTCTCECFWGQGHW